MQPTNERPCGGAWRLLIAAGVCAAATAGAQDAGQGQRLYREGVLASGELLEARLAGDVVLRGRFAACVNCHRRSGFGTGEGATISPPITGPALFSPSKLRRIDAFRELFQEIQPPDTAAKLRGATPRPAYVAETLAAALREGHDPAGREFDRAMPRYELDDPDMQHLITYLRGLSAEPPPGVDDRLIHFATVVADDVAAAEQATLVDVLRAFVRNKNLDTRRYLDRPGISTNYKADFYDTYRGWKLHIWQLEGEPSTWPEQLDSAYQRQPVFALLSGIAADHWQPVHEFCDRHKLPCLFPITDLPVQDAHEGYTIYLSPGVAGEARALAAHLDELFAESADAHVVQVYRDGRRQQMLAAAMRAALHRFPRFSEQTHVVANDAGLQPATWQPVEPRPTALVLWLDRDDLRTVVETHARPPGWADWVAVSSTLGGAHSAGAQGWRDRLLVCHRYELPGRETPRIFRVRSWLRARRIETAFESVALKAYFAASLAEHAVTHMVDRFSRDYFVEFIEHETENSLNPGLYPHTSLGPGQRFASRGCYILHGGPPVDLHSQSPALPGEGAGQVWIVP